MEEKCGRCDAVKKKFATNRIGDHQLTIATFSELVEKDYINKIVYQTSVKSGKKSMSSIFILRFMRRLEASSTFSARFAKI